MFILLLVLVAVQVCVLAFDAFFGVRAQYLSGVSAITILINVAVLFAKPRFLQDLKNRAVVVAVFLLAVLISLAAAY